MLGKTEKYILVDFLNEKGHGKFNEFIASNFLKTNSNGITLEMPEVIKKSLSFKKKLRVVYYTASILYAIYILFTYRKYKIFILSYNLVTLFFASNIIRTRNPIYIFEHNTFVPDNKLKIKLFKSINPNYTHLVFEEYIATKIRDLDRKSIVYPHPKLKLPVDKKSIDFLMVSSTVSERDVDFLVSYFSKFDAVCLIKDRYKPTRKLGRVETFYHLEDYEKTISRAKYVIIPQKFDFRVSGVFYDVILNVDTVFLRRSLFAENMVNLFPLKIIIFDEITDIDVAYLVAC